MIEMALAFVLGPLVTNISEAFYGQPSAALWKDQLFVAVNKASVYRGPFTPTARRIRDPIEYLNPGGREGASSLNNLDIRDDRFLLQGGREHYIFPMADVPLLEPTEHGDMIRERRGYDSIGSFADPYSGWGANLLFPDHRDPDVPVEGKADDFPEATYVEAARYSVRIAGPKTVRLFHAHKDKLFVSIELDYLCTWYRDKKGNIAKDLPKPPDRQLRTGKLPADFTERFAAYTSDKRDYLVTTSGKVYMAVPKGKDEVEVSAVWEDPKRKIVGVVQDQENDGEYGDWVYGWGFVTDSSSPERFYVKFQPKPVAVAYTRTVPLWIDFSDAYLESYECARAFRSATPKK